MRKKKKSLIAAACFGVWCEKKKKRKPTEMKYVFTLITHNREFLLKYVNNYFTLKSAENDDFLFLLIKLCHLNST